MAKEIALTQKQKAIVDDDIYDKYFGVKFYACLSKGRFYARNGTFVFDGKKGVNLHQIVIGNAPSKQWQITFKNGNSLDCRRENLIYIRKSDNTQKHSKTQKERVKSSKYLGVSFVPARYNVRIKFDGKMIHVGSFKTELEAAIAYDNYAKKLWGDKAKINGVGRNN